MYRRDFNPSNVAVTFDPNVERRFPDHFNHFPDSHEHYDSCPARDSRDHGDPRVHCNRDELNTNPLTSRELSSVGGFVPGVPVGSNIRGIHEIHTGITGVTLAASAIDELSSLSLKYIIRILWIATPLIGSFALGMMATALATDRWLETEEKMKNPAFNVTAGNNEFLSKFTYSGLWKLCVTNPGEIYFHCVKIEYFSGETYNPDPSDSTMAIPYAATSSAPYFVSAGLLLTVGYLSCIVGQCSRRKRLLTFAAAVNFIICGLVMLFGLIMYISLFKAEVGGKLKPRAHVHPPPFTYTYGYSFVLYVVALIASKLAGTSALFLYIYSHQYDWHQKRIDVAAKQLFGDNKPLNWKGVSMVNCACCTPSRIPAQIAAQAVSTAASNKSTQRRLYLQRDDDPSEDDATGPSIFIVDSHQLPRRDCYDHFTDRAESRDRRSFTLNSNSVKTTVAATGQRVYCDAEIQTPVDLEETASAWSDRSNQPDRTYHSFPSRELEYEPDERSSHGMEPCADNLIFNGPRYAMGHQPRDHEMESSRDRFMTMPGRKSFDCKIFGSDDEGRMRGTRGNHVARGSVGNLLDQVDLDATRRITPV